MKRFTVKETDMHESEGGWPGKVEVVYAVDAEKAQREGMATQMQICEHHVETARADERERIADMLEREMNAPDSKDHAAEWNRVTRDALRYAITCIRNPRPAKQEPKPLEKLFFTDSEWDGQLYRKFNALVDVVNELRGKK